MCTAAWGGIVSARTMDHGRERTTHITGFVFLAAIGTALVIWSGARTYDAQVNSNRAQKTLQGTLDETQQKLNQSLMDGANIKGQLSGFGTMMAQLGKANSDPTITQMAATILRMVNTSVPPATSSQAYISNIAAIPDSRPADDSGPFRLFMSMRNSGPSVLTHCELFARFIQAPAGRESEDRIFNEFTQSIPQEHGGGDLGAGQERTENPEPLQLSKEDVDDMVSGKRPVYVLALVRYEDQYGEFRKTETCMYYKGGRSLRSSMRSVFCYGHNTVNH